MIKLSTAFPAGEAECQPGLACVSVAQRYSMHNGLRPFSSPLHRQLPRYGCASSSRTKAPTLLFPWPTPRGMADVKDDNLVLFNRVENVVPKAADIGPTDTRHVGFLCGIGIVQQTSDRSIDAIGESCSDRRNVLNEIRNALFEFERRGVGVADPHVREERAFLTFVATCSSCACSGQVSARSNRFFNSFVFIVAIIPYLQEGESRARGVRLSVRASRGCRAALSGARWPSSVCPRHEPAPRRGSRGCRRPSDASLSSPWSSKRKFTRDDVVPGIRARVRECRFVDAGLFGGFETGLAIAPRDRFGDPAFQSGIVGEHVLDFQPLLADGDRP